MRKIVIPKNFQLSATTTDNFLRQVNIISLDSDDKEVLLDFEENSWFNAELSTFLRAIITRFFLNDFKVYISNMNKKVELILQKNGFLENYGIKEEIEDTYKTTIPFYIVGAKSIKEIDSYLSDKVFSKISGLRQRVVSKNDIEVMENAVCEVVHNIYDHSDSDFVIMCGQFYPSKEKVVFTIADTGVSLPKKVSDNIPGVENDLDCIEWAIGKGNSTKQVKSSGLGLYDISEQLSRSGSLHIISRNAYWCLTKENGILKKELAHEFSGTLINLEFHLDKNVSMLESIGNTDDLIF